MPSTRPRASPTFPACDRRPPRSGCTAGKRTSPTAMIRCRFTARTRPDLKDLGVEHPEWNQPLAPLAPLSRERGGLGRPSRGGPIGAGRARSPDACPVSRCPRQHRGGSHGGSTARGRAGSRRGLGEPAIGGIPRSPLAIWRSTHLPTGLTGHHVQKQSMGSAAMKSRASSSARTVPPCRPTARQRSVSGLQ